MHLSNAHLWIVILYFLLVISFSVMKTFSIPGKTIHLLRAFFPSWKLFEDSGQVPILFYRVSAIDENFHGWEVCLEKPPRQFRGLFLNAQGNYLLACQSLLQQLISDLQEHEDQNAETFEQTVSYRLTRNLALHEILKHHPAEGIRYQFKLSTAVSTLPNTTVDDILISPVYEV
jgi:hypothetical protein